MSMRDETTVQEAHAREHPHPEPREYVQIAIILAVITSVEVVIYYIPALRGVLVPILLILSILKFALVAMWFMLLRFYSRLFAVLFVTGILITVGTFLVMGAFLE